MDEVEAHLTERRKEAGWLDRKEEFGANPASVPYGWRFRNSIVATLSSGL